MPLLASYDMAAATTVLYDDHLSGGTVPADQGIPAFFRTLTSCFLNISGNFGNAVGNPRPHAEKRITDVIDPPFADRFQVI